MTEFNVGDRVRLSADGLAKYTWFSKDAARRGVVVEVLDATHIRVKRDYKRSPPCRWDSRYWEQDPHNAHPTLDGQEATTKITFDEKYLALAGPVIADAIASGLCAWDFRALFNNSPEICLLPAAHHGPHKGRVVETADPGPEDLWKGRLAWYPFHPV